MYVNIDFKTEMFQYSSNLPFNFLFRRSRDQLAAAKVSKPKRRKGI